MQLLQAELADLSAIKKIDLSDARLQLHYEFPAVTLGEILARIYALLDPGCLGPLQRCYFLIAGYMEQNEREHLEQAAGWQEDIKYIYAYYFARRRKDKQAAYKKQWQRYARK